MSRKIAITAITQSNLSTLGTVQISVHPENTAGDWTGVFNGKFYRQKVSPFATAPFYTSLTPPVGYELIEATQFEITDNASYAGRYTVYTPVSAPDAVTNPSSSLSGIITTIRVNESIAAPASPGDATTGFVSNVSTFYIYIESRPAVIVPPGVSIDAINLELPGRFFSGWGEGFNGDLVKLYQNFAGATPPVDPALGGLWFDTSTGFLRVYDGAWQIVNASAFAPAIPFTHSQPVASTTWTVNHNLGAAAPFLVSASFYVDIGGLVYKQIIPSDVTYVSANQISVTFTSPYAGYATVRL